VTEHKVQTFRGREFRVVRGLTHPEYSYHAFEREETAFRDAFWNVGDGDVVFDVGASYGSYALTACVMGATVYAFEPERTVFDDLVRNVELNGWQDRCFFFNVGMWSERAWIDMREYAPHWPAQTISGLYQVDSIDNFVKDHGIGRIDWIKVDVEGAERQVVRGALESIGHFGPKVLVECHQFLDHRMVDAVKSLLLRARNFNFKEVERDPCVMLIAVPK